MYSFGSNPACFDNFVRHLQADEVLGALWLAGHLRIPALQQAAVERIQRMDAGKSTPTQP